MNGNSINISKELIQGSAWMQDIREEQIGFCYCDMCDVTHETPACDPWSA